MRIEEKKTGDILVIVPQDDRIDASVSTEFKGRMVDWINDGHKRIVLDLSHVTFIDSSGLGAIVSTLKTIGDDGQFVLCCIRDTVMGLFNLTRMNRVFRIFATQAEAIEALTH